MYNLKNCFSKNLLSIKKFSFRKMCRIYLWCHHCVCRPNCTIWSRFGKFHFFNVYSLDILYNLDFTWFNVKGCTFSCAKNSNIIISNWWKRIGRMAKKAMGRKRFRHLPKIYPQSNQHFSEQVLHNFYTEKTFRRQNGRTEEFQQFPVKHLLIINY